jgi:hypothetical protein
MLGLAGLVSVLAGGVVAYMSPRYPAHIEIFETATGLLLLVGFALVAWDMPTIL